MYLKLFITLIILDLLFCKIQAESEDNKAETELNKLEPNTDNNCTVYRDKVAAAISSFTSCAIQNSRPITLCETCVDFYINVLDSYQNLSESKTESGYCIDDYVNLDRLQILQNLYKNTYDLWNKAKCYECFDMVNGTLTHNRSEETLMFDILLNGTLQCIHDNNATLNNQSVYCVECIDEYLGLNSYYESISNINEKINVCVDIVDLMNGTWTLWSKNCCEYRKKPEYIFLASTLGVTLLTILFYILTKFCTDLKSPAILQQSRLAESLTQVSSPDI